MKNEENSLISAEKNCSTYMKYYQGSNMSHRSKLPESVKKKNLPRRVRVYGPDRLTMVITDSMATKKYYTVGPESWALFVSVSQPASQL